MSTLNPVAQSCSSPELVPAVNGLLFEAEDDRAQVLVLREVVPVLRAVEVLLIRLLLDGGQLEGATLLEVLLDGGLLARRGTDGRHPQEPTHRQREDRLVVCLHRLSAESERADSERYVEGSRM